MVPDGKAGGEEAKHQERLGGGLVLDIVLHRVRQEEFELQEYLRWEQDRGVTAGGRAETPPRVTRACRKGAGLASARAVAEQLNRNWYCADTPGRHSAGAG